MKKHVGVLEQAGLVATGKVGRVRTCRLGARRPDPEVAWIKAWRRPWSERFGAPDSLMQELNRGAEAALPEQFDQLDALLLELQAEP